MFCSVCVSLLTSGNPVSVLLSDPSVYDEIMQPVLYSGYLYKSGPVHRGTLSRKTREGRSLGGQLRRNVSLQEKKVKFNEVGSVFNCV